MSLPIYQNEKVANRLASRCADTAWAWPESSAGRRVQHKNNTRPGQQQQQRQRHHFRVPLPKRFCSCQLPSPLPLPLSVADDRFANVSPALVLFPNAAVQSVSVCVRVCDGACWSRQMFKFAALLPVCISSGQMSTPWQKGNGCRH